MAKYRLEYRESYSSSYRDSTGLWAENSVRDKEERCQTKSWEFLANSEEEALHLASHLPGIENLRNLYDGGLPRLGHFHLFRIIDISPEFLPMCQQ